MAVSRADRPPTLNEIYDEERLEYRPPEHFVPEEEAADRLREVKVNIVAILNASQTPMRGPAIYRDYAEIYGETLDPGAYGFNNFTQLMRACRDRITMTALPIGGFEYSAIPTARISRLRSLVDEQLSPEERDRRRRARSASRFGRSQRRFPRSASAAGFSLNAPSGASLDDYALSDSPFSTMAAKAGFRRFSSNFTKSPEVGAGDGFGLHGGSFEDSSEVFTSALSPFAVLQSSSRYAPLNDFNRRSASLPQELFVVPPPNSDSQAEEAVFVRGPSRLVQDCQFAKPMTPGMRPYPVLERAAAAARDEEAEEKGRTDENKKNGSKSDSSTLAEAPAMMPPPLQQFPDTSSTSPVQPENGETKEGDVADGVAAQKRVPRIPRREASLNRMLAPSGLRHVQHHLGITKQVSQQAEKRTSESSQSQKSAVWEEELVDSVKSTSDTWMPVPLLPLTRLTTAAPLPSSSTRIAGPTARKKTSVVSFASDTEATSKKEERFETGKEVKKTGGDSASGEALNEEGGDEMKSGVYSRQQIIGMKEMNKVPLDKERMDKLLAHRLTRAPPNKFRTHQYPPPGTFRSYQNSQRSKSVSSPTTMQAFGSTAATAVVSEEMTRPAAAPAVPPVSNTQDSPFASLAKFANQKMNSVGTAVCPTKTETEENGDGRGNDYRQKIEECLERLEQLRAEKERFEEHIRAFEEREEKQRLEREERRKKLEEEERRKDEEEKQRRREEEERRRRVEEERQKEERRRKEEQIMKILGLEREEEERKRAKEKRLKEVEAQRKKFAEAEAELVKKAKEASLELGLAKMQK